MSTSPYPPPGSFFFFLCLSSRSSCILWEQSHFMHKCKLQIGQIEWNMIYYGVWKTYCFSSSLKSSRLLFFFSSVFFLTICGPGKHIRGQNNVSFCIHSKWFTWILTGLLISEVCAGETFWDTEVNLVIGRYSLLFLTSAASSSAKKIKSNRNCNRVDVKIMENIVFATRTQPKLD